MGADTNAGKFFMFTPTGAVDTGENWASEGADLDDGLFVEVLPNMEGQAGYDDSYGDWRPVK